MKKVIEACRIEGACDEGLNWLRHKPRTYFELSKKSKGWYKWLASHRNYPEVLELLSKDADDYVRRTAKAQLPKAPR
jgi:hypothetical protein